MAKYYYTETGLGLPGEHDMLYKVFAARLQKYPKGLSLKQVHFKIGSPMGMTKDETRYLVNKSVEAGYVEER